MLLHSLLDGHPEILHIPHTFKFYDFVAATPGLSEMTGAEIADAFVKYPSHLPLFDSQESVLLRGRLGANMDDRVVIDRAAFCEGMAKLLPGKMHSARQVFFAAVYVHAWCQGQSVSHARVVLMHLHHGDWLWPGALVETCNISSASAIKGIDILRPDKLIVSVRNPADQIRSLERFVPLAVSDVVERQVWFERYLKLLAQDWKRIELARASGISLRIVKLEDLRSRLQQELDDLACWMGIAPSVFAMNYATVFGLPWWGDIYSNPSQLPNSPEPIASPSALNPDHLFLYSAIGEIIASMKYPMIHYAGLVQTIMSLPLLPAPKRSWSNTRAKWKQDLASRHAFLEQLDRKHKQALAYQINKPVTPIGAEVNV